MENLKLDSAADLGRLYECICEETVHTMWNSLWCCQTYGLSTSPSLLSNLCYQHYPCTCTPFQIYVTSTSPSALSQMHRLNVIPEPLYQINGDQYQPSVRCLGATLSLHPSVRPMGINTCPSPLCQICRINTFHRPMRDILVWNVSDRRFLNSDFFLYPFGLWCLCHLNYVRSLLDLLPPMIPFEFISRNYQ